MLNLFFFANYLKQPQPQMEEGINIIKPTEVLKLMKMSKGYQWEIKLLSMDIKRLEELNNEMIKKFEDL